MSSPEEMTAYYRERLITMQEEHATAILVEAKRQSVALESIAKILEEHARSPDLKVPDEIKLRMPPKCVECGTPEYVAVGAASSWSCRRCGWTSIDGMTWCQPSKSAATVVERERDQTAPVGQAEDDDERRVADIRGAMTRAHAGVSDAISKHGGAILDDLRGIRGYIDRALSGLDNGYFPQRLRDAERRARENQEGRSQALRVLDEVRDKRDALAAKNNALFADYEALLVIHAQLTRSAKDHDARVEHLMASESAALEQVGRAEEAVLQASATMESAIADALRLAGQRDGLVEAERARVTDAVVAEFNRMRFAGRGHQFDVADIRMAASPGYVPPAKKP